MWQQQKLAQTMGSKYKEKNSSDNKRAQTKV